MRIRAVDRHGYRLAHLGPPRPAVLAIGAAMIVVNHDPRADARMWTRYSRPDGRNDAAWLVACDDGLFRQKLGLPSIEMQVAAAHSRSLDLDHNFARAWSRIRYGCEPKCAVATKHDAAHQIVLVYPRPANRHCI
ncbi:hypothetical protein ACQ3JU_0455 (plasmid) [Bradyrhizobium guangxiense]